MKCFFGVLFLLLANVLFAAEIPFTVSVHSRNPLEIGRIAPLEFQIQSQSDQPVMIFEIRPDQPCEEPISFVKTLYGQIQYDEKTDSYLYNSLQQQQSMIPVLEGYLPPGGSLPVKVMYRPFKAVETFRISYGFIGDQKIYAKGGSAHSTWFAPNGTDFSQIILSDLSEAGKNSVPLTVSFEPISGTEAAWCYCETLEGLAGNFPPELCKDWDTGETVQFRVGDQQEGRGPDRRLTGRKFLDAYPAFFGDGMYTHGEFIEISPEQSKEFIEKIRKKYLVNRIFYFFSKHYYDLEPAL